MVALGIHELAADWTSAKWLLWICLYVGFGLVLPRVMALTWAHQHHMPMRPGLKQIFEHGELGLVSSMLAISVIWDLQRSAYTSYTVALGSVLLALTAIMAGAVWVEAYCRRFSGIRFTSERAWRDSRNLTLLIFSLALVTEILLDRFVKVTAL